jgi:hypothetical protein
MDTTSIGINTRVLGGGPMPIIGAHCVIIVVTHNGGKVYQSTCGHGVWHIDVVPLDPIFNAMFYKKDINHECKLKIISLKSTSVFVPCYDGWKNNFKGGF